MLTESKKLILKMWSSTCEPVKKFLYKSQDPNQTDNIIHNEPGDAFY